MLLHATRNRIELYDQKNVTRPVLLLFSCSISSGSYFHVCDHFTKFISINLNAAKENYFTDNLSLFPYIWLTRFRSDHCSSFDFDLGQNQNILLHLNLLLTLQDLLFCPTVYPFLQGVLFYTCFLNKRADLARSGKRAVRLTASSYHSFFNVCITQDFWTWRYVDSLWGE